MLSTSWDAYRAGKQPEAGIARRQLKRLQDLVAYARAHSGYLANRYRHVAEPVTGVRQLPVTTKAEMMSHFDE